MSSMPKITGKDYKLLQRIAFSLVDHLRDRVADWSTSVDQAQCYVELHYHPDMCVPRSKKGIVAQLNYTNIIVYQLVKDYGNPFDGYGLKHLPSPHVFFLASPDAITSASAKIDDWYQAVGIHWRQPPEEVDYYTRQNELHS